MSNKENRTIKTASTPPLNPKMKNTALTIKSNQQKKKKMDQMSTYILETDYENNTNTVIKYYEKFTHDRIQELLKEAYKNVSYSEREGLDYFNDEDENQFISYIMWLISVRFTSLSKDVPTTLPEQIPIMLDMISTGLLETIHNDVLDQAEVGKILDKLQQFTSLVNQITNLEESTRNEILSSVQNKEILNYTQPAVIHPLVNPKAAK